MSSPHGSSKRSSFPHPPSSSKVIRQETTTLSAASEVIPLDYGFNLGYLIYTMPVTAAGDAFRVMVDTGSSDLWLTDSRCKSDSCTAEGGGSAVSTLNVGQSGITDLDKSWNTTYIDGSAEGDIYTTDFTITSSGTSITNQAFGSALVVDTLELQDMDASGIMGLGLPAASSIQDTLSPGSVNDLTATDVTGSVLSSLWSSASATQRIFSLGLQRLPSDGGQQSANSTISLGGVDTKYISAADTNQIEFNSIESASSGYWSLYMTKLQTTQDGVVSDISVDLEGQTTQYPTVVLASGQSLNYAPASLLNAMYGAFVESDGSRIGPGENGIYYVPCNLPINITITIGGVAIPIHPLDASVQQYALEGTSDGSSDDGCIGSFQSLASGSPAGADIVLGTPFLRSAYSVYTCEDITNSTATTNSTACTNPQIGLWPTTTNLTLAYEQFDRVRVQGQSLGSNAAYGISNESSSSGSGGLGTGGKIAIGIVIAIVGMVGLFILVLWLARKKYQKEREREQSADAAADSNRLSREKSRQRRLSGSSRCPSYGDVPLEDATPAADGFVSGYMTPQGENAPLSAKEQARLREAAIMHGIYEGDLFDDDAANSSYRGGGLGVAGVGGSNDHRQGRNAQTESFMSDGGVGGGGWDTNSKGYVDARRIKREYLKRHPSLIELQERRPNSSEAQAVGRSTMLPPPPPAPASDIYGHWQDDTQEEASQGVRVQSPTLPPKDS